MIFFITFLRAMAACLITNAHYEDIYPINIIANGGLIGDVLFFSVSGYCLCNIKCDNSFRGFCRWYGKRLWRIYPPVLVCTLVFLVIGQYSISSHNIAWWLIYPTYYHFIASIIILYIPFFFIMKIDFLRKQILSVMICIAIVWIIIYIFFYDRSYYHIDSVHEPMIRFLFMESMLLGALFRDNDKKLRNNSNKVCSVITIPFILIYFFSKLLFSKYQSISQFQFINQIIIFLLLVLVFRFFCGIDHKLENMPKWIRSVVEFLSSLTLEIYLVQYVLISAIKGLSFPFPINWILLTGSIIITAYILHISCKLLYKVIESLFSKQSLNKNSG